MEGKQDAIDEFLSDWLMMKKDWEDYHITRKYKHHMTSEYAPYPAPFAPEGYGFILIDFVSKTLISSQNYTSFTRITASDMFIPAPDEGPEDYTTTWERYLQVDAMNGLQSFYTNKETSEELNAHILNINRQGLYEVAFPSNIASIQDKIAYASKYSRNRHTERRSSMGIFAITPPSGWVFTELKDESDPQVADELMTMLAHIDWPITQKQEQDFYAFYNNEEEQ